MEVNSSLKEYAKMLNICQYGTATPCIYGCPKCKSEKTISELCDNDCTTLSHKATGLFDAALPNKPDCSIRSRTGQLLHNLTCSDCKSQYYKFYVGQNKLGHDPKCGISSDKSN